MFAERVTGAWLAQRGSARRVIARQTARKAIRSGVLWGFVFGLYGAVQALGYATSYKTAGERARLAKEFVSDAAVRAMVGPARNIESVGGFVAWKSLVVLSIVAALWGLLSATKLLRGEEDAGRWELLLAGQTTRGRAAAQALVGLGSGAAALWLITAAIIVVVGRSPKVQVSPGGAIFFATAVAASAVVFLVVGALASQLSATRRQASAYAGGALAASYALRVVADSGNGLSWLRWVTPLGWVEGLHPLSSPNPLALLPIIGLVAVLAVVTVHLAGLRDLGASTFVDRASSVSRERRVFGPQSLDLCLSRSSFAWWGAGVGLFGLLMGFVAKSAGAALSDSSSISRAFRRLGAVGTDAYLGVAFLMLAVLIAFVAASQVADARAEEASGRLENLLVRSVSRTSWFAGRFAISAAALVAGGLVAGVFTWLGAASQHAAVNFVVQLEAGLNIVPPAVLILGAGALVLGVWPRASVISVYGLLVWSFLVDLIGGIVGLNHWVLDTSVFHQMAAAPAMSPDWATTGVMVGLGALAGLVGGVAFRRRDLKCE
jgi:ABC-2 type transport system permease protein